MNIINRFKRLWGRKWGRRIIVGTAIILTLSIPMRCGGPYKGRIIEEDTDRPIPGALAVASWTTTTINVAGGSTRCLDAEETVSDENGEFVIKGRRGHVFGLFTGEIWIAVYKVGYRGVYCNWDYLDNPGSCYMKPRGFENGWAIFPLKKVAKGKMDSEGQLPNVLCGRKDGKPLVKYFEAEKEYRRAMGYEQ